MVPEFGSLKAHNLQKYGGIMINHAADELDRFLLNQETDRATRTRKLHTVIQNPLAIPYKINPNIGDLERILRTVQLTEGFNLTILGTFEKEYEARLAENLSVTLPPYSYLALLHDDLEDPSAYFGMLVSPSHKIDVEPAIKFLFKRKPQDISELFQIDMVQTDLSEMPEVDFFLAGGLAYSITDSLRRLTKPVLM